MPNPDRRSDAACAALITQALRFQRAFDRSAAILYLSRHGVGGGLASDALAAPYDRRARTRRSGTRSTSSPAAPPARTAPTSS